MIKNAKFIISVATSNNIRNFNVPEIAVAGRSNVGKSSLINFLCNQHNLARTSSEPGRTRLINYFEINNGEFYLVDLPGYGYARVNDAEKENNLLDAILNGTMEDIDLNGISELQQETSSSNDLVE